jgi:very-short-patch-repair endonuclease/predicted transcriptional regulator of viral defense system
MAGSTVQRSGRAAWQLAARDHNIVTFDELRELGFTRSAIEHRVRTKRLHAQARGVYSVGSPRLTREGRWMVAVKACGEGSALSHLSAAVLWGFWKRDPGRIHVSVPPGANPRRRGVKVHRRDSFEVTRKNRIPVTTPECTLIDLAASEARDDIEAMVNRADVLGLTNPEKLRRAAAKVGKRPGARRLRRILDVATFRFTRSRLERVFIPIAIRAGLPRPLTRQIVNGEEVDFYWPELKLVVETDGLTYHRTPQQQARDLKRDQKHRASGLTPLRFSHGQIRYEREYVERVLRALAEQLLAA